MFKIAKPPSSLSVLQAVIEAVGIEYLSKDLELFARAKKRRGEAFFYTLRQVTKERCQFHP